MTKSQVSLLISRLLIFVVLAMNLQCAVLYLVNPEPYAAAFELSAEEGRAVVIGFGILFFMWQVPYVFALVHPLRHFQSLVEAVLMQAIGLIGEWLLFRTILMDHVLQRATILRFILFDAAGLLLLLGALVIIQHNQRHQSGGRHAD